MKNEFGDQIEAIKIEGVMTTGKSLMKTEDKSTLGSCVVGQQVHEGNQTMISFWTANVLWSNK